MSFAGSPSPFANVHGPPDAEEFEWLDPTEILVGRVVQCVNKAIFGEFEAGVGNHDEAPRGVEREIDVSLGAVGKGCDVGDERAAWRFLDGHGAVVIEGGFVETEVKTVGRMNGERGMYRLGNFGDGGFFVVIFVAVRLVGGNVPSGGILVEIKFGLLVFDDELLISRLGWNFVAKGDAFVKNAKT